MESKTEAMRMEELAHDEFWLGVYFFNSRHTLRKAERHTSLFPIRSRNHSDFGGISVFLHSYRLGAGSESKCHGANQDITGILFCLHPHEWQLRRVTKRMRGELLE